MSWRDRATVVEAAPGSDWRSRARRVEPEGPPAWSPPEWDVVGPPGDPETHGRELARPVGQAETFAIHGANALPMGRPVVSAGAALVSQAARLLGVGQPSAKWGPAAYDLADELGVALPEPQSAIGGPVDEYRRIRDERDVRGDVGAEEHPWTARAGTGTGILATAMVPASAAVRGQQSLGRTMGTGSLLGGAQAAGDSRADLTRGEVGRQLLDTGIGSVFGAAGGAVGHAAARAAPAIIARVRDILQERAMNAGRRALLGGADSLSGRRPIPDEVVQEALDTGAIRIGGSTQGTAKRLATERARTGEEYGAVLDALEELGVQGPRAWQIADRLRDAALQGTHTTTQDQVPRAFRRMADTIQSRGMVGVGDDAGALGLRQAEALKRSAQDVPNYKRLMQNSSEVNEANKRIASIIREANEEAVDAAGQRMGGEVAELADAFVPLKTRLGRLIEASDAADRGAAAAGRRSGSSLTGTVLAAGRTGNVVTDDLLSRALTAVRGRVPSTRAVMQSDAAQTLARLGRAAQRGNVSGALPAGATIGGGSLAGDASGALLPATEEERSRYEELIRALSGPR